MNKFYLFECIANKVIVVEADSADEARDVASEHFTDSSDWTPYEMRSSGEIPADDAKGEIRHGAVNATDSISRRGT